MGLLRMQLAPPYGTNIITNLDGSIMIQFDSAQANNILKWFDEAIQNYHLLVKHMENGGVVDSEWKDQGIEAMRKAYGDAYVEKILQAHTAETQINSIEKDMDVEEESNENKSFETVSTLPDAT